MFHSRCLSSKFGFFSPVSGMLSSFSCTFYLYLHLSRFCFIRVGTIIFHLSRFAYVNWIYDVNTEYAGLIFVILAGISSLSASLSRY